MRVLMLLFNQVGHGTYWRGLYLARSLARKGHTLTVLATSRHHRFRFDQRPDAENGVTLVQAPDLLGGPLRSGWDPWAALARIGWSVGQHFELVHAFESRPTVIVPALYWQRIRGVPLVLDWCDWFGRGGSVEERPNPWIRSLLRPVETFFEEQFRAWADGTTVINHVLSDKAVRLGVPPEKILYLPNGCNVDEILPIPKSEARRVLQWSQDALVIGYLGRLFPRDARLMAQAFDLVCRVEPRARLLLAGYCNIDVRSLVAVPEAVWYSGHIRYDEIKTYLSACDLCWLPLRNSGANRGRYPLKINDYMAAGRPVVTTDVGDAPDLVRRGNLGLVAADCPEGLAEQTLTLLHDSAQRQVMGQCARHLAESEFAWDQIGAKLEPFYEQVLDNGLSGRAG